jgi:hypothetical protein
MQVQKHDVIAGDDSEAEGAWVAQGVVHSAGDDSEAEGAWVARGVVHSAGDDSEAEESCAAKVMEDM